MSRFRLYFIFVSCENPPENTIISYILSFLFVIITCYKLTGACIFPGDGGKAEKCKAFYQCDAPKV